MKKYVLFIALAGLQITQAYVRPRGISSRARQISYGRDLAVATDPDRSRVQQRLLEQQCSHISTQQADADARVFLRRRQQSYRSSGNPVFRLLRRLFS